MKEQTARGLSISWFFRFLSTANVSALAGFCLIAGCDDSDGSRSESESRDYLDPEEARIIADLQSSIREARTDLLGEPSIEDLEDQKSALIEDLDTVRKTIGELEIALKSTKGEIEKSEE